MSAWTHRWSRKPSGPSRTRQANNTLENMGKIKFGFIATDVTQNSWYSDTPYLLGIPFLPVLLGFLLHPKFHSITQSYNTTQPCHREEQPQKEDMADRAQGRAKKSPTTSLFGLFGCSKHTFLKHTLRKSAAVHVLTSRPTFSGQILGYFGIF